MNAEALKQPWEAVTCPQCRAETKVSLRTGCLYTHVEPGTGDLSSGTQCEASRRQIREPEEGPFVERKISDEPKEEAGWSSEPVEPYLRPGTSSVHTASAGLPGHGRKRR